MSRFLRQKKNITLLVLALLCIGLSLISRYPSLVERYYSNGIYPYIAGGLRAVSGTLPFSLGDILYTLFVFFILYRLIRFCTILRKKKFTTAYATKSIYTILFTVLTVYFLFNCLWGLNYNREGIARQLQLTVSTDYSTASLNALTQKLIQTANTNRLALGTSITYPNHQTLFNEAIQAYENVQVRYPFLKYSRRSIKVPVYNTLGSYLGYTGYYNPFTGEAQVNTVLPDVLLPYVACHEMAHQLGYATEDEANFAGYLSATASADPLFRYSTYLELYRYANNELWYRDSALAKNNYQKLDTLVKKDLNDLRLYFEAHENPAEKITTYLYGQFLKANQQPEGIDTYNLVTAWLMAYEQKEGHI